MPSLNRVHLIGLVATRLQRVGQGGASGLVLMTERPRSAGVDRHRIVTGARASLDDLRVGDSAYVRGHLERQRGRMVVVASEAFVLSAAPPTADDGSPAADATHRSPVMHERRGHLRHVAVGTPRERLVWVRATTVHGRPAARE